MSAKKTNIVVQGISEINEIPELIEINSYANIRCAPDLETLRNFLPGAEVLLGWNFDADILEKAWDQATHLKWIQWGGAGVDAVFLAGAQTRAEIEAVSSEAKIPLLLGGAGGELADLEFLGSQGVRVALQGHLPFQAAVKAVYDTLKALRDGVAPADLKDTLASAELMGQLTRKADYDSWIKDFLN